MPRTATPSTSCCFPRTRAEAFEFGAQAFDLADRLQTTIFLMLDLDIGMNHRLCRPLKWDDDKQYDRGKVMTAADARSRRAISAAISTSTATASPTAPIPARIRPRARSSPAAPRATATRATPRKAPAYADNMQRLLRKFETAKDLVPRPLQANADKPTKYGVIYFGSTSPAMDEAIGMLEARRPSTRPAARARLPVPFQRDELHRRARFVYVVEQNRDASCAR